MIVTLIKIVLETTQPWRIAAPEVSEGVDLPVATDGAGHIVVPASSLAGGLRAHLGERAAAFLGSERAEQNGDDLTPSPLRILGTRVTLHGELVTYDSVTTLGRTAIDPWRAAAAARSLRSEEILPEGCRIEVFAELDGPLGPDERERIADWVPGVGGGRSRGMGAAKLCSVGLEQLDLRERDSLIRWLALAGPESFENIEDDDVNVHGRPAEPLLGPVTFEIVDGLHIGGGRDPDAPNRLLAHRRGGTLVVEGSTWKGVLRSRCAFILASLGYGGEPAEGTAGGGGTAAGDDESTDAISLLFGTTERRGLVSFDPSTIVSATTTEATHVAVDRFTGGAVKGGLFSEELVTSGSVQLVVRRIADVPDWGKELLAAAVRDIADGYVGIGSGTTRGKGTLRLADGEEFNGTASLSKGTLEALGLPGGNGS